MNESWILDASPVITMAKAGYLQVFDQLAETILIPEAVSQEILVAPPSDSARKALESGWGRMASPAEIPPPVLEWGLGHGESAVLALAVERPGCTVVLDDGAARRCARSLNLPLIGTLGAILRARRLDLIPSAAQAFAALRAAGLHFDDEIARASLGTVGEAWTSG